MPALNKPRLTLATVLLSLAASVHAAPPTVEIVAMAHPPVIASLKPLRDWLARQGDKVSVVEIDAESPSGERKLSAAGLRGHIPILILIDGRHEFTRKDGVKVALVKFPAIKDSPPGMRGNWLTKDVQDLLIGHATKP
jgi:hypothetical protein